jgi:hypothetical protein
VQGKQTRDRIADCTTPGGECYQEGQKRTGEAIQILYEQGIAREKITRTVVRLAAACADKPGSQTAQEILLCIEERMPDE